MSRQPQGRFTGPTPPPGADSWILGQARRRAAELARTDADGGSQSVGNSYSDAAAEAAHREQAMSDSITFPCPACGTKYTVGPHHAGKKTICKKCQAAMTVPEPDVGNPTVVGATRTIKRADIQAIIDSGTETQQPRRGAPPPVQQPAVARKTSRQVPQPVAEVDMKGGASVMRRPQHVHAPQPVGRGRPTHRTPYGGGHHPTHAVAHTAGVGPGARKKSPLPMVLGISGGALALIIIVIMVAAFSGQPGQQQQTAANNAPQVDPAKAARDSELKMLQSQLNNAGGSATSAEIEEFYKEAKKRADDPEFKLLVSGFADAMARKADGENASRKAAVGLLLDADGNLAGKQLLNAAAQSLPGTVKKPRDKNDPRYALGMTEEDVPNPVLLEVAKRLGWKDYEQPKVFDEYDIYNLAGWTEYKDVVRGIPQRYLDLKMMPQAELDKLKAAEKPVLESIAAFEEEVKRSNGFAKKARSAFIRFKTANDSAAVVNRLKGKRSFSPKAMDRENEPFDEIWTYTYWEPFVLYVEKPPGRDGISPAFNESLASKAAMLKTLVEFFKVNFVEKFSLKRVKPKEETERAEKEGWPLQILVFKDEASFRKFAEEVSGGAKLPPGARAYYSPVEERVVTYDDTSDVSPDTMWFNESVLIHETFHMLSDHYAANPMFSMDELRVRPSFSSILVQEGLTDCIAGFRRTGGEGHDAKYEFMQLNHLRLKQLQGFQSRFTKNQHLFRIQDMVECRNYGHCMNKALQRWRDLKLPLRDPTWIAQNGFGLYYAAATQAAYFFQYYEEGGKHIYRDKWWDFLGKDYRKDFKMASHDTNVGVEAFKQTFGITDQAGWDDMQTKYEAFVGALKPEDVGKGGEELPPENEGEAKDGDKKESRMPWHGSRHAALPGQRRRAA